MIKYLIVCPLVFLAAMIDAIAGGGGLITLPAYMLAGLPVHLAIGTNKISSSMAATMSLYRYGRKGFVPWKLAAFCVVFAIAGSTLGAKLSLVIEDTVLKIVMLVLLPLTAVLLLRGNLLKNSEDVRPITKKTYILSAVVAFFISAYDGFYGPGTGVFLLLLFTSLAHIDLQHANGLAKAVNYLSNITAVVVFLINGSSMIKLGLIAGLFGICGSYVGTSLFAKDGVKIVKPVMIGVLTIFFIKVLFELING